MWFEYDNSVYVDESDIERMRKKARKGDDPEEVFEDWRAGQDDVDYYALDYVRDQIINLIKN